MHEILVTGFEPFGGGARNPSGDAARRLDGATIGGHRVRGLVLPCVFAAAPAALHEALAAERPALVLCLGLAAARRGFHPERVAINWIDARIADNAGAQPLDRPVHSGGPAAHFTTLPVKAMVAALQAAGHAAAVSHSAGTFVCNQVFYALMQALSEAPHAPPQGAPGLHTSARSVTAVASAASVRRGGFMHVGGDLDAEAVAAGTRVAIEAALARPVDGPADLQAAGGAID